MPETWPSPCARLVFAILLYTATLVNGVYTPHGFSQRYNIVDFKNRYAKSGIWIRRCLMSWTIHFEVLLLPICVTLAILTACNQSQFYKGHCISISTTKWIHLKSMILSISEVGSIHDLSAPLACVILRFNWRNIVCMCMADVNGDEIEDLGISSLPQYVIFTDATDLLKYFSKRLFPQFLFCFAFWRFLTPFPRSNQ